MKRTSFFGGALRASAPLWVWAAHFGGCYVAVAIGCDAGWHGARWAGLSALQWGLVSASVIALAVAACLLLAACRAARRTDHEGLALRVGVLGAALSLVGIAWTTTPVLWLPTCHLT
jgi:hypothetical protein